MDENYAADQGVFNAGAEFQRRERGALGSDHRGGSRYSDICPHRRPGCRRRSRRDNGGGRGGPARRKRDLGGTLQSLGALHRRSSDLDRPNDRLAGRPCHPRHG